MDYGGWRNKYLSSKIVIVKKINSVLGQLLLFPFFNLLRDKTNEFYVHLQFYFLDLDSTI